MCFLTVNDSQLLYAGNRHVLDSDFASLLVAVPEAAGGILREAWHEFMSSGAAVAASSRPCLLIEVVADFKRNVVMRWSTGREQVLPLQLDLPEAVRCLAGYLHSGMALLALLRIVWHAFALKRYDVASAAHFPFI